MVDCDAMVISSMSAGSYPRLNGRTIRQYPNSLICQRYYAVRQFRRVLAEYSVTVHRSHCWNTLSVA